MTTIYDFSVRDIDGQERSLSEFKGQVLLVVNVASKCGFTPQYAGLENLYRAQKAKGFTVLGFPCDQFGHQEPGTEGEIKNFCSTHYDITFPLFAKILVNGENADPLYQWLKSQKRGILGTEGIKWNFTKFLVGRDGQVIKRFAPTDAPDSLTADIDAATAVPANAAASRPTP
jgi:glutathione peroxidase